MFIPFDFKETCQFMYQAIEIEIQTDWFIELHFQLGHFNIYARSMRASINALNAFDDIINGGSEENAV